MEVDRTSSYTQAISSSSVTAARSDRSSTPTQGSSKSNQTHASGETETVVATVNRIMGGGGSGGVALAAARSDERVGWQMVWAAAVLLVLGAVLTLIGEYAATASGGKPYLHCAVLSGAR